MRNQSAHLQHPVVPFGVIRQNCIHTRSHLCGIQPQVLYLLQHIMHVLCWALEQVENAEQQLTRSTGLPHQPVVNVAARQEGGVFWSTTPDRAWASSRFRVRWQTAHNRQSLTHGYCSQIFRLQRPK